MPLASTTPATPGQNPVAAPGPSPTPTAVGYLFAVPAAGDTWAMNGKHLIAWNREGNVPGGLYLVDEATGKMAGWIVPFTAASQTSVAWDTRDVAIDRTGGTRKNLSAGTYSLRLMLTGKGEVQSVPFRIVSEGSTEAVTQMVRMRDTKLSPTALTVLHGTKIVFVNNETKQQTITGDGLPTLKASANGGTATLDTSGLLPKVYFYLTDLYTYQSQGTLTVQ
ncbi:MAG: hypothetical protein RL681_556 [Candidatus Parcubacteria bacterium]